MSRTSNYTPVASPFVHDCISGTFAWEMTDITSYVNLWCFDSCIINGVSITTWTGAANLPPEIDGKYYIDFSSNNSYAHFEAY